MDTYKKKLLGMIIIVVFVFIWAMYMAYDSYKNPVYHVQCNMISNTTELITTNYTQALEYFNDCNNRRDPNMQDLFDRHLNQTFDIRFYNISK